MDSSTHHYDEEQHHDRTILGIRFYGGTTEGAVDEMLQHGGLLVVPAAPALVTLPVDQEYRRALLGADLAITDSAYMVMLWNLIQTDDLPRVSGLAYLRELLGRDEVQKPGDIFWVMASPASAKKNLAWLRENGLEAPSSHIYMAPMNGQGELKDEALLQTLEALKPKHIVVTVGGGTQERLGLYLREHLSYRPGIHCIGAAIAFLSGDQAAIPTWADKLYLGWLLRILDEPKRYGPRYLAAFSLAKLMMRYKSELPPLCHTKA